MSTKIMPASCGAASCLLRATLPWAAFFRVQLMAKLHATTRAARARTARSKA